MRIERDKGMRLDAPMLLSIDALNARQCRYRKRIDAAIGRCAQSGFAGKRDRGCIGMRRESYALFVGLLNHRGGDFKRFERAPFREGVGGNGACFTVERNDGRKGNRCVMLAQGQAVRLPRPGVRHGAGGMVSSVHKCLQEMSGETLKGRSPDLLGAYAGQMTAQRVEFCELVGQHFGGRNVEGDGFFKAGNLGGDLGFGHDLFSGLLPSQRVRHGLDIRRNEPYRQQVFSTFDCAARQ